MKLTDLLPERILYRVNTPKWASMPTSGAGAAAEGGRFNRAGVEALYLSLDESTALREYQQDEPIMPPGTIAAYHVALDQVVDFTAGYVSGEWEPIWEDWSCNWRHLRFLEEITPPSWDIGDLVIKAGIPGMLFPSTRNPGGTNLVVYLDLIDGSDQRHVRVHDPDGKLPKTRASWNP
ncbi:MAG: RES family NAD+ phosphorylase [Pseudomonadota bacterium]